MTSKSSSKRLCPVKTRKAYPYRSITATNYAQTLTGRFFGISILILYEPGQIPALVDGIDNSILMELFLEFQQLLLKRSNREMVHATASGINLKATGSDEPLEKNTLVSNLINALGELQLSVQQLDRNLGKERT
ncbi:MAG: hypothetical protein ACXAEU_21400 [Candidatus Hodarchaeales archaeon]|jgi:hypothetical protein